MPPRDPRQPDRVTERYRERLNDEMTEHGYTDRSLAEKLTEAGFPIGHTAIFKTRKGTRQPSLDECMWIARKVFGYRDLDSFIEGPITVRIWSAVQGIQFAVNRLPIEQRAAFHDALRDLSHALQDAEAVAVLDEKVPDWRQSYLAGMRHDLRWIMRDLVALWRETEERLEEIFAEHQDATDA